VNLRDRTAHGEDTMTDERDGRDERMQGGGYGGVQGRSGEGRDTQSGLGDLQGGSYGRNPGREPGDRQPVADASDEERARLARPPREVDEDGNETTIEDEGRSAERGEIERTDLE
jgi:hypothetical protein